MQYSAMVKQLICFLTAAALVPYIPYCICQDSFACGGLVAAAAPCMRGYHSFSLTCNIVPLLCLSFYRLRTAATRCNTVGEVTFCAVPANRGSCGLIIGSGLLHAGPLSGAADAGALAVTTCRGIVSPQVGPVRRALQQSRT